MNKTMKIALGFSGFVTLLALTIPANFNAPQAQVEPDFIDEEELIAEELAIEAEAARQQAAAKQKKLQRSRSNDFTVDTSTFGQPTSNAQPVTNDSEFVYGSPSLQPQGINNTQNYDEDDYFEE